MDNNNNNNNNNNNSNSSRLRTRTRRVSLGFGTQLRVLAAVRSFPGTAEKSGPLPASKESIDALTRIIVTEDCRVKECAICLEDFKIDGEIREMPCKHGFHSGCIEKWLSVHGSCPVCRFVMPVQEENHASDDDGGGGEYGRLQRRRFVFASMIIGYSTVAESNSSSGSDDGSGSEDLDSNER